MSLFILQEEQFFFCLPRAVRRPKSKIIFNSSELSSGVGMQDAQIMIPKNSFLEGENGSAFTNSYVLPEIDLAGKFKGILLVKPQGNQGIFLFRMALLTPQETFFKIQNSFQIGQTIRNLTHHHHMCKAISPRLALNGSTREIKINFSPILAYPTSVSLEPGQKMQRKQILFFKNILRPQMQFINQLIKCVFKRQGKPNLREPFETYEKRQLKLVQRYCDISTVSGKMVNEPLRQKNASLVSGQNKQSPHHKVSLKREKLDYTLRKSLQLFSDTTENMENEYQLQDNELRHIENLLLMPTDVKMSKGADNSSVINYIHVKQPANWDMVKINQGGFADIYQINLSFWQLGSKTDKVQLWEENMTKREVVLKKEVSFNSEFQLLSKKEKQEKTDKKGRVEHELDILNKMVGAKPIFLPKYYIPVNKNVIFPKSLLMDYIPTKTLAEFLKSYDASLSLQTKLSYMFSIAQSMRYLREFNVVHLDLKPSNILMYHNMLVKIIDFGESYHPDICDKDFCPGFTVPYSCPELYYDHRSYTSKADIFSIGVIFYEMLYSRCPFDIHVNTTRIDQEMSKYSELWYFSPEEYESYGESEVLRLLNVLISRCLAVQPEDRPELDWIALIIRQLVDLVK